MTLFSLRPLLLALLFSVLHGWPARAHAETTSSVSAPVPLAQALTGDALAAYEAGRLLFDDGDYAGAGAKFLRAHALSGDHRLLWNMAVCEKERRNYASASNLVQRYLTEGDDKLTAAQRDSAAVTLETLQNFSSEIEFVGVPDGARIFVDDVEVGEAPLPAPLHLDLGTRRVRIEVADHLPFQRTVEVPGRVKVSLTVELEPDVGDKRKDIVPAYFSVVCSGNGDTIRIDGRVVGHGRFEGPVEPGERLLRITAPGKKPFEQQLLFAPGGRRTLQVTLDDEQSKNALWPWIAGGAVIVAGAAVGGYFLFAPREESVEGPTGSLGSASLPMLVRFR